MRDAVEQLRNELGAADTSNPQRRFGIGLRMPLSLFTPLGFQHSCTTRPSFPPLDHAPSSRPSMPRRASQGRKQPLRLPGQPQNAQRRCRAYAQKGERRIDVRAHLERRRGRMARKPGRHKGSGHRVPKVARAVEQVVVRDLPIDRPVNESSLWIDDMCSCQSCIVRRAVAEYADVAAASAAARLGGSHKESERLDGDGLGGSGGDSGKSSSPSSRISRSTTMIRPNGCSPKGCTLRPEARVDGVIGAILSAILLHRDGRLDALRDSLRDPERLVRDARVEGEQRRIGHRAQRHAPVDRVDVSERKNRECSHGTFN